jgi:hypothetical protein
MAGFPVSERLIYQHDWMNGLDWDDDENLHPEGDGASTGGGTIPVRVGSWILTVNTKRCHSI